jgi:osmoprotectant transport system ATP-binding protein
MIKLDHVGKVYPDGTEAVRDVSLEIDEGEFCVLLGPSGCGKTTTLKMINRLIPLTSGHIYVNGANSMQMDPNELRRGIGYAIQNIGLFPHYTVQQNICTVPELAGWPKTRQRARAEELLDLVGMDPGTYLERYPSELSGGQQQRVGVARALGADPPVLLMDEPFGAIDPITRSRLQDEFLKIQAKLKKTIAFVTHDIDEAIKMGDTIALMKEGDLVQYADPATLLYAPKNEFVRNFVGGDRVLKSLRLHRVREVMEAPPVVVRQTEGPLPIRRKMEEAAVQWAMVTDEEQRFLGWLSIDDVSSSARVADIIEAPIVTAEPSTPLNEALSMMLHSAIGNLAVIDEREHLKGVITFPIIRQVMNEQAENSNADDGAPGTGGER